jgi:hypothetical protein
MFLYFTTTKKQVSTVTYIPATKLYALGYMRSCKFLSPYRRRAESRHFKLQNNYEKLQDLSFTTQKHRNKNQHEADLVLHTPKQQFFNSCTLLIKLNYQQEASDQLILGMP